jgi:hypothetical protein
MTTTIPTDHTNELILVDDVLDPRGSSVVALGLINQDGSDTFPGRTLTPDQAEELAASLAQAAAAARATAGSAATPLGGEQAYGDTLKAIRAAVPLTGAQSAGDDGQGEQADPPAAAAPAAAAPAAAAPAAKAPAAKAPAAKAPAAKAPAAKAPAAKAPAAKAPAAKAPAAAAPAPPPPAPKATPSRSKGAAKPSAPARTSSGDLPIADYDQLSAPVITKRLSGLSGVQLSKLLAYEQSHRNRKTICERITALQASAAHAKP